LAAEPPSSFTSRRRCRQRDREIGSATRQALGPLEEAAGRGLAAFFRRYQTEFAAGDRCLELGVGEGRQLGVPASHGLDVYGIDCDPLALEILTGAVTDRGIAIQTTLGEIDELPYPDRQFRVVYATSVLQFLPDLRSAQRVFREVERVLLPGGLFFVAVSGNPKRENAARERRLEYLAFHEMADLAERARLRVEDVAFETTPDEGRVGHLKLRWLIVFRRPA
jgi:SAM-dependent methyltransferase